MSLSIENDYGFGAFTIALKCWSTSFFAVVSSIPSASLYNKISRCKKGTRVPKPNSPNDPDHPAGNETLSGFG